MTDLIIVGTSENKRRLSGLYWVDTDLTNDYSYQVVENQAGMYLAPYTRVLKTHVSVTNATRALWDELVTLEETQATRAFDEMNRLEMTCAHEFQAVLIKHPAASGLVLPTQPASYFHPAMVYLRAMCAPYNIDRVEIYRDGEEGFSYTADCWVQGNSTESEAAPVYPLELLSLFDHAGLIKGDLPIGHGYQYVLATGEWIQSYGGNEKC